jgi:DNA-directed RNA polymerase subunit RPC12/RpoP
MLVKTSDGTCRSCRGQLEIIDADDATMTVECQECGESYLVEPDAFGDGCMTYYVGFLAQREGSDDEEGGE